MTAFHSISDTLKKSFPVIIFILFIGFPGCKTSLENQSEKQIFLEDLKERTFNFFWELADSSTYQVPDRYPTKTFTSIAATGFGLASYLAGIENGYITRQEGADRVLKTLMWLWNARQGPGKSGNTGYKGFFYHFLTFDEGTRYQNVELSTIDTGWLMAGILACQSYFTNDSKQERMIRGLADSLYRRVNWEWAMNGKERMSMGWRPEEGFISARWKGYNEAMMLIIMAMGSPTHPIPATAWESWSKTYQWSEFYGYEHVNFSPLFGHQYSHMFIDFRNIQDPYMKRRGINYFENSRRATLANRQYCIDNPGGFEDYSENIWGLSACDGPENKKQIIEGDTVQFFKYSERGASSRRITNDGTITPTAAGGSIPFAPKICTDALYAMKQKYGDRLYKKYGFKDAFNMTYESDGNQNGWVDDDYLGINQGPIIIQLENHQTELIWNVMKKNKYIIRGLKKAGFTGGWLNKKE